MVAERPKWVRELRNEALGEVEAEVAERKAVGETGEGCGGVGGNEGRKRQSAREGGEMRQGTEILFSLKFAGEGGNS